jgi:hypothetical protein
VGILQSDGRHGGGDGQACLTATGTFFSSVLFHGDFSKSRTSGRRAEAIQVKIEKPAFMPSQVTALGGSCFLNVVLRQFKFT